MRDLLHVGHVNVAQADVEGRCGVRPVAPTPCIVPAQQAAGKCDMIWCLHSGAARLKALPHSGNTTSPLLQ